MRKAIAIIVLLVALLFVMPSMMTAQQPVSVVDPFDVHGIDTFCRPVQIQLDELRLMSAEALNKLNYIIVMEEVQMSVTAQQVPAIGNVSRQVFKDDFFGSGVSALLPWWKVTKVGSGLDPSLGESEVTLETSPGSTDGVIIELGNSDEFADMLTGNGTFEALVQLSTPDDIGVTIGIWSEFGMPYAVFDYSDSVDSFWNVQIRGQPRHATTVAVDTNPHTFKIVITSTAVTFYIGDDNGQNMVQVYQETNLVGLTGKSSPRLRISDEADGARTLKADYVEVTSLRI